LNSGVPGSVDDYDGVGPGKVWLERKESKVLAGEEIEGGFHGSEGRKRTGNEIIELDSELFKIGKSKYYNSE
jgi:hypothetical protein